MQTEQDEVTAADRPIASVSPARTPRRRFGFIGHIATPVAFLLVLLPVYGLWLGSTFLSPTSRMLDVHQSSASLLIALGLVVVLSAGQFDLSVATVTSLAAVLTIGLRVNQGLDFGLVLVIVIVVCALAGVINGLLVTRVRLNPFIATLGTNGLFLGAATVYTGGQQLNSATPTETPLPTWFAGTQGLGSYLQSVPLALAWVVVAVLSALAVLGFVDRFGARMVPAVRIGLSVAIVVAGATVGFLIADHLSWPTLLVLLLATVLWVFLRYTAYGRGMYAVGSNPVAARLAGVGVDGHVMVAFIISGTMAGLGGIVFASTQGSAFAGLADATLLPAYAAVFLSTVIFSDGRFHVWGTVLGVIAVVFVAQGLIIGGVGYTWIPIINGLVLIIAVSVSTVLRRQS